MKTHFSGKLPLCHRGRHENGRYIYRREKKKGNTMQCTLLRMSIFHSYWLNGEKLLLYLYFSCG